jgi:hypothetical protein
VVCLKTTCRCRCGTLTIERPCVAPQNKARPVYKGYTIFARRSYKHRSYVEYECQTIDVQVMLFLLHLFHEVLMVVVPPCEIYDVLAA